MASPRLPFVALLAAALSLPATSARAIEWIADRDIGTYCQQFLTRPNSPSGAVCLSYIQGFLDGLRTTETPAFSPPEKAGYSQASQEEVAAINAARMNALVSEFGPPARAGICLPEDLSRDEIVRVVARALRYGQSSGRSALDDYAQTALQERYPCDTSDPVEETGTRQDSPDLDAEEYRGLDTHDTASDGEPPADDEEDNRPEDQQGDRGSQ